MFVCNIIFFTTFVYIFCLDVLVYIFCSRVVFIFFVYIFCLRSLFTFWVHVFYLHCLFTLIVYNFCFYFSFMLFYIFYLIHKILFLIWFRIYFKWTDKMLNYPDDTFGPSITWSSIPFSEIGCDFLRTFLDSFDLVIVIFFARIWIRPLIFAGTAIILKLFAENFVIECCHDELESQLLIDNIVNWWNGHSIDGFPIPSRHSWGFEFKNALIVVIVGVTVTSSKENFQRKKLNDCVVEAKRLWLMTHIHSLTLRRVAKLDWGV